MKHGNENNTPDGVDLTRRKLLKASASGLFALVATNVLSHFSIAKAAQTGAERKKVLVIYYSRTGHTREVAHFIERNLDGDIIQVQTVMSYPDDYEELKKVARRELDSEYQPELKTTIENPRSYDLICLGYPIWWGTFPAPVRALLAKYDWSGKAIAPFCTHLGSRLGRSVEDLRRLCPNSPILEGLAVRGNETKTAMEDVYTWLRKLGLKE